MDKMSEPNRRTVLAATAAAGALSFAGSAAAAPAQAGATQGESTIRPFRINIPDEALVDLRRRVAATRWPEKETVADTSQGVQLATMQQLAQHWQSGHTTGGRSRRA